MRHVLVMNIGRKGLLFRVKDVYFSPAAANHAPRTDMTRFYQCAEPFAGSEAFHTLHIDLRRDDEALFASFDRRTRAELRKTIEPGLYAVSQRENPTDAEMEAFAVFFDAFAREKGIGSCDRTLLANTRTSGRLMLSAAWPAADPDHICCMHAHSCDGLRTRAIYSCSGRLAGDGVLTAGQVARANRLLHFEDMKYYRDRGVSCYDFGGLSLGDDPAAKGVDEFKMGFGGRIVDEYNGCLAHSARGRFLLAGMRARDRLRAQIGRRRRRRGGG